MRLLRRVPNPPVGLVLFAALLGVWGVIALAVEGAITAWRLIEWWVS